MVKLDKHRCECLVAAALQLELRSCSSVARQLSRWIGLPLGKPCG